MKFELGCSVTVSAYTTVEAESLEDAIRIAKNREVVITMGHDGADENEQWLITEPDGTPTEIHQA